MESHEVLNTYTPRDIDPRRWATIRPTVHAWVAAAPPASASTTIARARVTAHYVNWCLNQDFPFEAEVILTENLIEAWFHSKDVSARYKGTYRSHLRTVAKANTRKAIWTPTPTPMRRASLRDPYTEREVSQYLALIPLQSTPRRQRVLDALLHLGLGFGLRPGDMHSLTIHDITYDDGLVLLTINNRTVPALTRYAAGITRIVETTEGERIFGDHLGTHRRFDRLVENLDIPKYAPPLRGQRLRTTWLVEILRTGRLTLPEFQRISGLKSARVLDDLIPYLDINEDTLLRRAAGL